MLTLINRHRWWFLATTVSAVLLRLFFILKLPLIVGDSLVYGSIAKCILSAHIYGIGSASGCVPTLIRLPGYPSFLALTFGIFGQDRYVGAMLFQLFFDVLTCFLIADITRRALGGRATRAAFLLAAFCPFLMSYVAAPLTECLEIFCTAAAIDCALVALDVRRLRWWALCGAACSGAILLRADGGLLLGSIGLPLLLFIYRQPDRRRELITATLLLGAVSLAPLVPWTIRNWRVFHVFQPLVTVHATDPGEFLTLGWERWYTTWLIDYSGTEDIGFHVSGERIDINDVPGYAFASPAQRAKVAQLFDQYNERADMSEETDREFGIIAAENIRRRPIRHYLLLPIARVLDMWFRPRTEMLPLDVHFWQIRRDPHDAWCAIAIGLVNLAYVGAAIAGLWLLRRRIRYLPLLLTYPVVRSLFLATTGASEDRYTLECYPVVILLAAGLLGWYLTRKNPGLSLEG